MSRAYAFLIGSLSAPCLAIALGVVLFSPSSYGKIGFLLHESIGNPWYPQKKIDTGFLTQGGHGALLISDICAESPTKLRECEPNEHNGIVLSRYAGLSKEGYDWLAIPHSYYFYGVPTVEQAPLYANKQIFAKISENFYKKFLSRSIARIEPNKLPPGRWKDTLAASFRRDVFSFNIATEEEFRHSIISNMNRNPNQSSYDFFFKNCSDFAADFFKKQYTQFKRTNLGDLGFTSPIGVAKSVADLGHRQSSGQYDAYRYSQLPGSLERSRDNLYPIENTIKNPKWTALMFHFKPILLLGTGLFSRAFSFDPNSEYESHFSRQASVLSYILARLSEITDEHNQAANLALSRGDSRTTIETSKALAGIAQKKQMVEAALTIEQEKYFGSPAHWLMLKNTLESLRQKYQVPPDFFERAQNVHWEGESLVLNWPDQDGRELQAIIAGEGVGNGDRKLLLLIRISRLAAFVEAAQKNRPEVAKALEELDLITEIINDVRNRQKY